LALLRNTGQFLFEKGSGVAQAAQQAQELAYTFVKQQAAMLSFIDNFWMLGIIFLALIPLALALKPPVHGKGPTAALA